MTQLPIDLSVLLIHAPVRHPACRRRTGAVVAAELATSVKQIHQFDAGRDFFHHVMVTAGLSEQSIRVQSAQWSGPEEMIGDLTAMDAALQRASAAYKPARIGRGGFYHQDLNTIEDLIAFRDDPRSNPFRSYAFMHWQPFSESGPPDAGVLCVATAGQIPAALTLAHAWRKRWPGIPLLPVGPGVLPADIGTMLLSDERHLADSDGVRRLAAFLQTIKAEDPEDVENAPAGQDPKPGPSRRRQPFQRPLIVNEIPAFAREALAIHRNLIVWNPVDDDADAVSRQLHAVARQGIWNHLVLDEASSSKLEKFALANANIVHSWCRRGVAASAFSDAGFRYAETAPPYGETVPMPGTPLWMVLRDPVYIEAALERIDLNALTRMRVRDDGRGVFEVGRNLNYYFVPPAALPGGYLEEIVRMVAAGGSVNTQFVKHNLERAHLIAYAEEEGVIIGNSSLKHPRDEYIDAVSRQTGIDLHNFLERGYTSVRPEYRGLGIGAELLAGLTQRAGDYKIFSVIAESNIATQKMAMRNRTRRVASFFSQRAHKEVGVWIPEWMLPEGIELPEQPDFSDG